MPLCFVDEGLEWSHTCHGLFSQLLNIEVMFKIYLSLETFYKCHGKISRYLVYLEEFIFNQEYVSHSVLDSILYESAPLKFCLEIFDG